MTAENIGKAITGLGLEDKFLSDEGFLNFSLKERGEIVSDIIYEKLRLGRWDKVVEIIYNSSSKINALFDGDRQKLQKEIIKSAIRNPSEYIDKKTIEALAIGNNDLLLKLAIAFPLNYEKFKDITSSIDSSYYKDPEKGDRRKRIFNRIAGKKALKDEQHRSALWYFEEANYQKGLTEVFESAITKDNWDTKEILETIALSDPEQKESRLRRIISGSNLKPLEKFGLYQKHNIPITKSEKRKLYEEIAKTARRWDLQKELSDADPKLKLSWAKKYAKTEPRTSYKILKDSNRKQDEAAKVNAVISGLQINSRSEENKNLRLGVTEIGKRDLIKAYEKAPFDVKVNIAQYLRKEKGFDEELKKLSGEAYEEGKLGPAYELWWMSGSGFDGEYMDNIKKKLIEDGIENHFGYMHFLHKFDKTGKTQVFDALMQQRTPEMIHRAYDLAVEKGVDTERLEKVRKAMVKADPQWALRNFRGHKEGEIEDPKGVEYVVEVISEKYGVNKEILKGFVEKYPSNL